MSTDGSLIATTKTAKVQNEKFRVLKVASEITLRRQVWPAHSRERASDFWRQSINILGIPYFVLEGAGSGEHWRYLAEEAEQKPQRDKTSRCNHRCDQFQRFVLLWRADGRLRTNTTPN